MSRKFSVSLAKRRNFAPNCSRCQVLKCSPLWRYVAGAESRSVRCVFEQANILAKLLGQGFARSAIIFGSTRQYDRCQRRTEFAAGSDETSLEVRRKASRNEWPPFFH